MDNGEHAQGAHGKEARPFSGHWEEIMAQSGKFALGEDMVGTTAIQRKE
jgi:hypothetical protein